MRQAQGSPYLVLWRFVLRQGVVHVEAEELDLLEVETPVDKDPANIKRNRHVGGKVVYKRIDETRIEKGWFFLPRPGRTCVPRSSGSGRRVSDSGGRNNSKSEINDGEIGESGMNECSHLHGVSGRRAAEAIGDFGGSRDAVRGHCI